MHFQDAPINCISSWGEKGEGEKAGRGEGKEKASDPEKADRPPFIFLLANKWGVGDKVLEAPSEEVSHALEGRSWVRPGGPRSQMPQAEALLTCSSQGWAGFMGPHQSPSFTHFLLAGPRLQAICLPMTQEGEDRADTDP